MKRILGIAAVFSAMGILSGCLVPRSDLPPNTLKCYTSINGYAYIFKQNGKPEGEYHFLIMKACSWKFPSEFVNGQVRTYTNPPTTLVLTNGTTVTIPVTDNYIISGKPIKITP